MTIAERLDELMKLRKVRSQAALSRLTGVPQPTINRILSGVTETPDTATVQKLAAGLDSHTSWLVDGVGPGPQSAEHKPKDISIKGNGKVEVWENSEDLLPDENRIWVDRYDYHFSAGTGLIQWEVREKKALPFNATFFKALGSSPRDCRLVVVRGDSMEPFLFNRDLFMVDVTKTRIKDGSIYAIYFEDEPLVKQVFKQAGGGLVLHSYNDRRYPDKVVEPDKLEYVKIVGELIYRSGSGPAGGN